MIKCVKIHHLIAVASQPKPCKSWGSIGTVPNQDDSGCTIDDVRIATGRYHPILLTLRNHNVWAINLLLLCEAAEITEHDISLMSANYFETSLAKSEQFSVLRVELDKYRPYRTAAGDDCELTNSREIRFHDERKRHGQSITSFLAFMAIPAETGDIQSYFNLIHLPILAVNPKRAATASIRSPLKCGSRP